MSPDAISDPNSATPIALPAWRSVLSVPAATPDHERSTEPEQLGGDRRDDHSAAEAEREHLRHDRGVAGPGVDAQQPGAPRARRSSDAAGDRPARPEPLRDPSRRRGSRA